MNALSKSAGSLGRAMVQDLIPGFTRISQAMTDAAKSGGFLSVALAGVKQLFTESFGNPKILGDVGQIRREIIKTQESITQLSGKKDSIFFDKNALAHEQEKLAELEISLQKAIGTSRDNLAAQAQSTEGTKKFAIAIDDSSIKLKKNNDAANARKKAIDDAARVEHEYVTLLKIERRAQEDLLKPYQDSARSAKDRLQSLKDEQRAVSLSRTAQISMTQAIELTTIARLEEKRTVTKDTSAIKAIEDEISARKEIVNVIKQSESETEKLAKANKQTADDVSQLWTQAGRNIQSALANGIFNFFDDGLKGMLKNVISTVGRIASEFAALKLAQSIGLAGIFGGASGAASASTGGSLLGGASNLFGSLKGGFGLSSLFGGGSAGVFGNAGGAGTAFIGGPGTALGGTGLSGLSTLGSGMTAIAGPLAALAASVGIGSSIAGDKKVLGLGGTTTALLGAALGGPIGAIVAGSINALFGRGPLKFRQQSLQGDVSSKGFDGEFTNVFRAKGGLLRSNGHKSISEQLTQEQQDLFDTTISGFYKSASGFAKNLGLSTDLVDTFTQTLQIKSEKNKQLTEEAITEMLGGIGDSLAKNVIPGIEDFRKTGEKAFDTFARLNNEFVGLTAGAQNLGASVGYAKELITSMSIAARTEFVDAAGGLEALNNKTSFFFSNFLSASEQFGVRSSALTEGLQKLGLSADLTVDQFKSLVQSAGTSNELRIGLLDLAPSFIEVKKASEQLGISLDITTDSIRKQAEAQADYRKILADLERNSLQNSINSWQELIDTLSGGIKDLLGFADSLKGTVNSLVPKGLDSARADIINATAAAQQGQITDVSGALSTIGGQTSGGFSSRNAFERSKAFSLTLVSGLSDAILGAVEEKQKTIGVYLNNIKLIGGSAQGLSIPGVTSSGAATNSSADIIKILQALVKETSNSGKYSQDLYNLLRNMTNDGNSLNTAAV